MPYPPAHYVEDFKLYALCSMPCAGEDDGGGGGEGVWIDGNLRWCWLARNFFNSREYRLLDKYLFLSGTTAVVVPDKVDEIIDISGNLWFVRAGIAYKRCHLNT